MEMLLHGVLLHAMLPHVMPLHGMPRHEMPRHGASACTMTIVQKAVSENVVMLLPGQVDRAVLQTWMAFPLASAQSTPAPMRLPVEVTRILAT